MLKHQYRGDGYHRIVKLTGTGWLERSGDWVPYSQVATFAMVDAPQSNMGSAERTSGGHPVLFVCFTKALAHRDESFVVLQPDVIYKTEVEKNQAPSEEEPGSSAMADELQSDMGSAKRTSTRPDPFLANTQVKR